MRWQLILKELISNLIYVKCSKNIVADTPSCTDEENNLNINNNNNVEPTLDNLSKTLP